MFILTSYYSQVEHACCFFIYFIFKYNLTLILKVYCLGEWGGGGEQMLILVFKKKKTGLWYTENINCLKFSRVEESVPKEWDRLLH